MYHEYSKSRAKLRQLVTDARPLAAHSAMAAAAVDVQPAKPAKGESGLSPPEAGGGPRSSVSREPGVERQLESLRISLHYQQDNPQHLGQHPIKDLSETVDSREASNASTSSRPPGMEAIVTSSTAKGTNGVGQGSDGSTPAPRDQWQREPAAGHISAITPTPAGH